MVVTLPYQSFAVTAFFVPVSVASVVAEWHR